MLIGLERKCLKLSIFNWLYVFILRFGIIYILNMEIVVGKGIELGIVEFWLVLIDISRV
jgi:hypothetical protein